MLDRRDFRWLEQTKLHCILLLGVLEGVITGSLRMIFLSLRRLCFYEFHQPCLFHCSAYGGIFCFPTRIPVTLCRVSCTKKTFLYRVVAWSRQENETVQSSFRFYVVLTLLVSSVVESIMLKFRLILRKDKLGKEPGDMVA